jgi:phospholipid/cholesterol/gamma-HCH transport system substrate-binding protein
VSTNLTKLDFANTLNKVNRTLDNIQQMTEHLNSKDNSLGLLLNDRTLYDNLNITTQNASNLLLDLKEHPKRYIHISVF